MSNCTTSTECETLSHVAKETITSRSYANKSIQYMDYSEYTEVEEQAEEQAEWEEPAWFRAWGLPS